MTANSVVLVHGSWSRGGQFAQARNAFEERGYTVYTPTLRHHELPLREGASKISTLSVRDYTADLVEFVDALPSAPLLVGHSLGGLLVQLVAARTRTAGVVAACPTSPGPSGLNPTTLRIGLGQLRPRAWAKPVYPPSWKLFRDGIAHTQSEEMVREVYDDLVCESGRILNFELAMPWLDRARSAQISVGELSCPVLVLGAEYDRIVPTRIGRRTAARYRNGTYAEIARSDHMVFSGDNLAATMGQIDRWVAATRPFG